MDGLNPRPPFSPQQRAALDAYHAAQTPSEAKAAHQMMVAAGRHEYFDYGEGYDVSALPPAFRTLPLDDQALVEDTTTADGIFIKRVVVPKAESWVPQHAHVWDHTTLLTNGAMFVWKDGVLDRRYQAPASIFIPKDVKHLFRTLEDNTTFFCIHNLHGADAVAILSEHDLLDEVT